MNRKGYTTQPNSYYVNKLHNDLNLAVTSKHQQNQKPFIDFSENDKLQMLQESIDGKYLTEAVPEMLEESETNIEIS